MRSIVLAVALVLPLAAGGCGDQRDVLGLRSAPSSSPSTRASSCWDRDDTGPAVDADLDGDGRPESVTYTRRTDCSGGPALVADVGGHPVSAPVAGELPVTRGNMRVISVPGRTGDVLVVEQHHPRGGFQARLYGYANGTLAELTVGGEPVFPFVATDTLTDPTSARCVDRGLEVTHARAHTPLGVVPAWDVFRTTYTLDGNTVSEGATQEIADNVLEKDFRATYRKLVDYSLFENCRAGSA